VFNVGLVLAKHNQQCFSPAAPECEGGRTLDRVL
jgi:hypothetical protein